MNQVLVNSKYHHPLENQNALHLLMHETTKKYRYEREIQKKLLNIKNPFHASTKFPTDFQRIH